ncbi:MAG: hypothetical protein U0270_41425 [Labilithrix sp.]
MKRPFVWAVVATLVATAFGPLVELGCAGETGSKRFSFEARAGGALREDGGGPLTFSNQRGWTIKLTKADVTIGPLYLNVVPPLRDDTQGLAPSLLRRDGITRGSDARWAFLDLFERRAWAYGEGHLESGRIVGEVLGQLRFSALSPELVSFPVTGSITQEEIRTAEVWFYPDPGVSPDTTKIDTVALDVVGEATKGSDTVRFRGALTLNDAWQPDAPAGSRSTVPITDLRKVRGIPAPMVPSEGGHLELRFDVTRLFRGADFSNLESNPADKDGTKVLVQAKTGKVTTDQVMTNLYQGLRASTGTYDIRWVGP